MIGTPAPSVASCLAGLIHSRKFLVLVLNTTISTVLFFGGKYLAPDQVDNLKFLVVVWQPAVLMLIYSIAKEDAAAKGGSA